MGLSIMAAEVGVVFTYGSLGLHCCQSNPDRPSHWSLTQPVIHVGDSLLQVTHMHTKTWFLSKYWIMLPSISRTIQLSTCITRFPKPEVQTSSPLFPSPLSSLHTQNSVRLKQTPQVLSRWDPLEFIQTM